jgi:hypothetical protein
MSIDRTGEVYQLLLAIGDHHRAERRGLPE